ncbi:hypothetical protein OHV05_04485 [Kitasatospora sp. NBC_00070]|uniref:hypothetical protein n=1 Tax=Kitasatospora sp. NBC_00070 TaxID=2975962 RepID=UPI00324750EB
MRHLIVPALLWVLRSLIPDWRPWNTARPAPVPSRPYRLTLAGQQGGLRHHNPATRPVCSRFQQPIPVHVVARTIMPRWQAVREPVNTYTRQAADKWAVQRGAAAQRRAVEWAARAGMPDPLRWLSDAVDADGCLTRENKREVAA